MPVENNEVATRCCRPPRPFVLAHPILPSQSSFSPLLLPGRMDGWQYEFYTIRVARGEVTDGLASPDEPEVSFCGELLLLLLLGAWSEIDNQALR